MLNAHQVKNAHKITEPKKDGNQPNDSDSLT